MCCPAEQMPFLAYKEDTLTETCCSIAGEKRWHIMEGYNREREKRWLALATGGIRFGPDRRAVSEELAAHLEDKTADLQRIFPDMTESEVWDRTLKEMGDPRALGKELAKIHRPWLGYLWRASTT